MAKDVEREDPDDGTDPRLALLLSSVFGTGPDATMELTVVIDGTVVSGSVVSEQAWTQRQNDQVRIGSWAIAGVLESGAPGDAADRDRAPTAGDGRYIHFLAPVLLSGDIRVPLQATRVDARRIAAWSIGRIPEN
ncbi:hypothetical protein [Pseudarthrobacter phenanthrenivorans]|uniref:Uncharacterized protein n=1 Tax=Pseudarthrobacter phenanthrenivorans TaxID=361575 RepID=A0A0B4D542_PSEPS|nr:hypothetical protein [Pseudarthrobacter phenanthrenivorans]KIC63812.1 hypothetical protein RM50_18175 [Pseudarthrobacter phenanthrenivorans]